MTEPGRVSSVGYVAQYHEPWMGRGVWRDLPAVYDSAEEAQARCDRWGGRTRVVQRTVTDEVMTPARVQSPDPA